MLGTVPARPEQSFPNTLSSFVRESLRAAALAPTLTEALDLTGEALCNIARGDISERTEASKDHRFGLAHDAADRTMILLDRIASLFQAIQRCAREEDCAIVDLAALGREIAQAEAERIDIVFSKLAHRSFVTEVHS